MLKESLSTQLKPFDGALASGFIDYESRSMLLEEAMAWRYAVSKFSDRELPERTLKELLDATRNSASSYGLQPFKVLVIKSREKRLELLPHAFNQLKVADSSHLVVFAAETDIGDATVERYIAQHLKVRGGARSDIEGYGEHMKQALAAKSQTQKQGWAHQQAYIALGTLLTASALLGVDAAPMTGFDHQAFDDALGLSARGLTSSSIVALGYRAEDDDTAALPKVRRDYDEWLDSIS